MLHAQHSIRALPHDSSHSRQYPPNSQRPKCAHASGMPPSHASAPCMRNYHCASLSNTMMPILSQMMRKPEAIGKDTVSSYVITRNVHST